MKRVHFNIHHATISWWSNISTIGTVGILIKSRVLSICWPGHHMSVNSEAPNVYSIKTLVENETFTL